MGPAVSEIPESPVRGPDANKVRLHWRQARIFATFVFSGCLKFCMWIAFPAMSDVKGGINAVFLHLAEAPVSQQVINSHKDLNFHN